MGDIAKLKGNEYHERAADDERAPGSVDSLEASPQMGSGVWDIKEEEQMPKTRTPIGTKRDGHQSSSVKRGSWGSIC